MDALYTHLCRYDSTAWRRAVEALAPEIHAVDRTATRIWFAFFPLDLHLALEAAGEAGAEAEAQRLRLMGRWRLADQIDVSHRFLYGHRYWPQVKSAVAAAKPVDALPALITAVADAASRASRVDRDRLVGIGAVGLMTLRQAGAAAFARSAGTIHLSSRARAMTPQQILKRRARDDRQGIAGFLRGPTRRWTVTFDEDDPEATFRVIHGQELATAARDDRREYRSREPRCTPGEGPIPVECRAASCGTCWVGVIGGADKLSPVVERDERQRMRVFGYLDSDEPQPVIRLACQARAFGSVSIVIPPWNGFTGGIRR